MHQSQIYLQQLETLYKVHHAEEYIISKLKEFIPHVI